MIEYRKTGSDAFELSAHGRITKDEIIGAWARLAADMPHEGKIKLLEIIGPLDGVAPAAIWEDLKRGLPMVGRVSHAAIVADQAWITALTKVGGRLHVRRDPDLSER